MYVHTYPLHRHRFSLFNPIGYISFGPSTTRMYVTVSRASTMPSLPRPPRIMLFLLSWTTPPLHPPGKVKLFFLVSSLRNRYNVDSPSARTFCPKTGGVAEKEPEARLAALRTRSGIDWNRCIVMDMALLLSFLPSVVVVYDKPEANCLGFQLGDFPKMCLAMIFVFSISSG